MKTYDEWIALVLSRDCWTLSVPDEFLDYRMYLAAVTADGRDLLLVPRPLVDRAICLAADSYIKHYILYFVDIRNCKCLTNHVK
jgi:hypothetical protein